MNESEINISSLNALKGIRKWMENNLDPLPKIAVACPMGQVRSALLARVLDENKLAICTANIGNYDDKLLHLGIRLVPYNFDIHTGTLLTENKPMEIDALFACYSHKERVDLNLLSGLEKVKPVLRLIGEENQFVRFFDKHVK